jgi:hypothetical protein
VVEYRCYEYRKMKNMEGHGTGVPAWKGCTGAAKFTTKPSKDATAIRAKVLMLGLVAARQQFGARIARDNLASFSLASFSGRRTVCDGQRALDAIM